MGLDFLLAPSVDKAALETLSQTTLKASTLFDDSPKLFLQYSNPVGLSRTLTKCLLRLSSQVYTLMASNVVKDLIALIGSASRKIVRLLAALTDADVLHEHLDDFVLCAAMSRASTPLCAAV